MSGVQHKILSPYLPDLFRARIGYVVGIPLLYIWNVVEDHKITKEIREEV